MSKFKELRKDTKLMSGIYILSLVTALLILALVIRGPEKSGSLIMDDNGNVTGIRRDSMSKTENYDLSLEVKDDETIIERNVTLSLQARSNGSNEVRISDADDREAAINAGIDTVIAEVEYSKKRKIVLPKTLPDGTDVTWKNREVNDDGSTVLLILVMYISLLAVMTASRLKEDRTSGEQRKSILRGLPRFCNQLFLMMNAGLILSDAFDTVTESYTNCERELTRFEKDLSDLREATDGHRISTARVINEYAVKNDVKELIRIAAILTENERRGSDVIESLSRESRYLWDERKIVARESGKMIDTKMSYPLGLLLILLIVITMAPALLNM